MNAHILLLFIATPQIKTDSGVVPSSVVHTSEGPTISHEITTFSEQSALDSMVVSKVTPEYDINPYRDDTLYGFLQRPRIINTFVWDDTLASGARLGLSDPYFSLLTAPAFRNKIENFNYFKAGLRVGVRINGTPFHYGKLMVVWKPMCGSTSQQQQEMRDNIFSSSAYPNIVISPTENEVNEMVLPFAYDAAYIDLSLEEIRSPGQLFIYVLNPLALDATVPPVTVSVFVNFEDVSLAGQSGIVNLPTHTNQVIFADPNPFDPVSPLFVAQGDMEREAIEKSKEGVISGPLKATSSIAGSLTTVPIIGAWAAATSVVTSALGSIFEHFGYCKPNSLETTAPRILRVGDFALGEGVETAPLSQLIPGQCVTDFSTNLGGTQDDMDMLNILSTPALRAVFRWQGNDQPPDSLFTAFVNPQDTFTVTQGGSLRVCPTMLAWASKEFGFWRGSLRYDVQVTCSNFHSGRFRVSFQPKNNGSLASFDYQNTINRIVDIQNETEFSFTIPYIADNPWQSLNIDAIQEQIGQLKFSVVNELTHTSEPIPEVYINLWVSAGPDFQLAMPTRKSVRNAGPAPAPTSEKSEDDKGFEAQGLTSLDMKTRDHPPLLESATGSVEHNICQTDTVTHLKQVLHRPSWFETITISPNDPDLARIVNLRFVEDPNTQTRSDYLDWYANIFAFSRGSYNVRLVPQWNIASFPYMIYMQQSYGGMYGFRSLTATVDANLQGTGQQLCPLSYNPVPEVNIPYYATKFAAVNGGVSSPTAFASSLHIQIAPSDMTRTSVTYSLWRSAGDDFHFSYLIGPPTYFVTLG